MIIAWFLRFGLLEGNDIPSNPSNALLSLEAGFDGEPLELEDGRDVKFESLCESLCESLRARVPCALEGCTLESGIIELPTGPSVEPGIDVSIVLECLAMTSSRLIPALILN